MKYLSSPALYVMITLIISACAPRAPQAAPTINPVDLQSTMVAAAMTVVAETQAAIPTATPPPPTATFTDTPVPTNTFLPVPSSEVTFTPGGNSGGDPCIYKVLPGSLEGEPVRIRIDNGTNATVSVSVNLQQTELQSVCGYRGYTIEPGQFIVITDLVEGCYTIWAWNPDPEDYFIVTNGTSCLDASGRWGFTITTRSIEGGS